MTAKLGLDYKAMGLGQRLLTLCGVGPVARGFSRHPIGRRRPVRSIANFAAWQLRSRLGHGPHKVPFVNGTRLWARRGETGVTGNIYYGLHEFEDMAFVAHALRPGDLFADIGANAGSYTVMAAGVAGARVIAVEPVPDTLERLRANIALNAIGERVSIEACALTESAGTIRFTTGADTVNHVAAHHEASGVIEVPARTADELFAEDAPQVVKIDVEGHEAPLLRGAPCMLGNAGVWALVLELAAAEAGTVCAMLSSHGFQPRKYDPFSRRLIPAAPSIGAGNTLFLRVGSEAALAARLYAGRHLNVHGVRV